MTQSNKTVTFIFDDEHVLNEFLGYMSDGGGEQWKPKSCDYTSFDYAKCFPAWGYNPEVDGPREVVVTSEFNDPEEEEDEEEDDGLHE